MDIFSHSILPFLAMIVVLIVVHELGHFVTAKLAGVKVLEFGLGYPPKVWGIKRGETEYTINALPLGGFVRLLGEEDPSDPRSLAAKPRWVRLVVLGSGAAMNVVLAVFLFSLALMIPREVDVSRAVVGDVVPGSPAEEAGLRPGDIIFAVNGREVQSVGELGYQIRLHMGETIDLRVKPANAPGREIDDPDGDGFITVPVYARWSTDPYTYTSALDDVAIGASDAVPIEVRVTSTQGFGDSGVLTIDAGTPNEEAFTYRTVGSATLILTERAQDGTQPTAHAANAPIEHKVAQGPTGITIGPAYGSIEPIPPDEQEKIAEELPPGATVPATRLRPFSETRWTAPWDAVPEGARKSYESIILARNEIISRIRGGVGGSGGFQVTGPVGIAQLTGEVVDEAGWKSLMDFAALLSMNLAVLNILPLPMLDGGRVVFVLLEYLRGGRRIAPQKEAMVHLVGLVLILTLAVVITYFDLVRLIEGEGILR
jgi:regulator of sigma E protease